MKAVNVFLINLYYNGLKPNLLENGMSEKMSKDQLELNNKWLEFHNVKAKMDISNMTQAQFMNAWKSDNFYDHFAPLTEPMKDPASTKALEDEIKFLQNSTPQEQVAALIKTTKAAYAKGAGLPKIS